MGVHQTKWDPGKAFSLSPAASEKFPFILQLKRLSEQSI